MASLDSNVYVKLELRPCTVKRNRGIEAPVKAFFHRWCAVDLKILALVEYEDGKCGLVDFDRIRFLDSGALFYEQGWPDDEEIPLF